MAAVLPVLQVVAGVVSAIGALRQGSASSAASNFNATVATQNAQIARQEASDQAARQDRETYLRLGTLRANASKNGGGVAGSALDVLADVAYQSKLENQQILYAGELKARGYDNSAALDTAQAANARSTSYLQAGTDLLTGGVKAYDSYKRLNTSS